MKKKLIYLYLVCISLSLTASDCEDLTIPPPEPSSGNDSVKAIRLTTTDGGSNWDVKDFYGHDNIISIAKIAETGEGGSSFCVVAKNKSDDNCQSILRVTNNGQMWTEVYRNNFGKINDVAGNLNGNLFAVSEGSTVFVSGILVSTNQGTNWGTLTNKDFLWYAIAFGDEMHGMILPENPGDSVYISVNSGNYWYPIAPIPTGYYINDVSFISSFPGTEAVVCGHNCKIFRTTNLGENWEDVSYSQYNANLNSVGFIDPVGIIVGDGGIILRSHNRGQFWSDVTPGGATHNLKKVFLDGSAYWAVGDKVILKSTNQGQTWQTVRFAEKEIYKDLYYSKGEGIVVGVRIP